MCGSCWAFFATERGVRFYVDQGADVAPKVVDIGWGVKAGLPYQPWAAQLTQERMALNRATDPNSQCLPTGIVRMHTTPLYRKVVQTPSLVVILNERVVVVRVDEVAGHGTFRWASRAYNPVF